MIVTANCLSDVTALTEIEVSGSTIRVRIFDINGNWVLLEGDQLEFTRTSDMAA